MKKFVSIDLETSGLDPENHQILEVGAIIEDTENELRYEDIPKFYKIINHDTIIGNPYAINMNQRIFKILAGIPQDYNNSVIYSLEHSIINEDEFVESFYFWLKDNLGLGILDESITITVAGKNVSGFDLRFLNNLPSFSERIKTHHRTIDPSMLFTDMKTDAMPVSLQTCMNRANIKGIVSHNALQDAWDVIRVLRTKY